MLWKARRIFEARPQSTNMGEKYYITTPIYYVNAEPHIGHAYTTFAADVLARYKRMTGADVYFLTGTDDNSQKNVEAAGKAGKDVAIYIDEMAAVWKETWKRLNISINGFIRTTEERHRRGVEKFWRKVLASGDIHKGIYEGYYCVGCESYLTEKDLQDGVCPLHKQKPEILKEENYFFKLSNYKEKLLKHIEQNPGFIQPKERRHEIINYITEHLEDISISRRSQKWGIPVPDDPEQVIYVWFDALINYLTAIGYGTDDKKFSKWWPADLHLMAKDIIKFHCALWPAMLMSAGLKLPKCVFAHGYFSIDGEKISKTLGNVINPTALCDEWGRDSVLYFLFREIPFGGDGDFSYERLANRYHGELSNGLGNLVARVTKLAGETPALGESGTSMLEDEVRDIGGRYKKSMENLDFEDALECVWSLVAFADAFLQEQQPWKKEADDKERIKALTSVCELLWHTSWLLEPFMPDTSEKIFEQLGGKEEGDLTSLVWNPERFKGRVVKKGEVLFPRKE